MTNKINVAVIGANFGKRVHLPAFSSIENVNIVKLCSKHTNDALDAIRDNAIHAVCLSVPPTESLNLLLEALSHGKHVFCEKPLATNLQNAEQICKRLRSETIHAINFEICESKIIKKLKSIIDKREYGKIKSFKFSWRAKNYNSLDHIWKFNVKKGGGVVNNFGSHIFNLLEYLFSEKIINITGSLLPSIEFNTIIDSKVDFNDFNGSLYINADTDMVSEINFEILCDDVTLLLQNNSNVLKNFSLFTRMGYEDVLVDEEQDTSTVDGRIELTNSLASKFINGIQTQTQIHPNILDGFRVQYLTDQLAYGK